MASETVAAGAAEAAAEHAQGMPQLDFATYGNQIFWLLVTLVVLHFILSRIALPRIAGVLADRRAAIENDLARAEEFRKKAVEAEAAYNQALADARFEAQQIIAASKAEIQADLDKAIAHADAEIAAKAAESERRIAEIRAAALESVRDVATETAVELVRVVAPGLEDDKAIAKAVVARVKG